MYDANNATPNRIEEQRDISQRHAGLGTEYRTVFAGELVQYVEAKLTGQRQFDFYFRSFLSFMNFPFFSRFGRIPHFGTFAHSRNSSV